MMPWLLSGGTLLLHHGFDAGAFAAQCREDRCDTVVVPGALVPQLAEAGLLAHAELKNVLAVWRRPERLMTSPAWQHANASLTDMLVFGETALIGLRRDADGLAVPLPAFAAMAPRGSGNAVTVAETARTRTGTMALRGPMVPRHPFPPGAERLGSPHLKADAEGFVDTFYACRIDRMMGTDYGDRPAAGRRQRRLLSLRAERAGRPGPARERRRFRHGLARRTRRAPPRRHFRRRWRHARGAHPAWRQSARRRCLSGGVIKVR